MKQKMLLAMLALVVTVTMGWPADAAQRATKSRAIEKAVVVADAEPAPQEISVVSVDTQLVELKRRVEALEIAGIFTPWRRPEPGAPDPNNPSSPTIPDLSKPPQFEFENADGGDAESAGLRDWSPEQWQSFFTIITNLIATIMGLFGGGVMASRASAAAQT